MFFLYMYVNKYMNIFKLLFYFNVILGQYISKYCLIVWGFSIL